MRQEQQVNGWTSGVSSGNNNHQQQHSNQNQHFHDDQNYGTGSLHQGQSQVASLSNGDNRGYKTVIKEGAPTITKNFYVYAAPEEEEEQAVQVQEQIVRPQKHYKIIFIKAPSSGLSQAAQQAAAISQVI